METQQVQLTRLDRCDSCSAAAKAIAYYPEDPMGTSLLFCGHHMNKNRDGLKSQGFEVLDYSDEVR